jgi:hypothetical protein
VYSTLLAVKHPFIFFAQFLKLLLATLHLIPEVTLREAGFIRV